jgi:hypothetical protein
VKRAKNKYIRRIKSSDRFMDFDPFDNPFGGGTRITYPKVTPYILSKFKYGMFEYGGSNICYSFGHSKSDLRPWLKKRNNE